MNDNRFSDNKTGGSLGLIPNDVGFQARISRERNGKYKEHAFRLLVYNKLLLFKNTILQTDYMGFYFPFLFLVLLYQK